MKLDNFSLFSLSQGCLAGVRLERPAWVAPPALPDPRPVFKRVLLAESIWPGVPYAVTSWDHIQVICTSTYCTIFRQGKIRRIVYFRPFFFCLFFVRNQNRSTTARQPSCPKCPRGHPALGVLLLVPNLSPRGPRRSSRGLVRGQSGMPSLGLSLQMLDLRPGRIWRAQVCEHEWIQREPVA